MRIACWLFAGRVALEEQGETLRQYHVIHNWFISGLGRRSGAGGAATERASHFDSDGCKILSKPLIAGDYPIIELP